MIVRAESLQQANYRTDYAISRFQNELGHLVVRRTTPDNPFINKAHAGSRFWFILDGHATVTVGDERGDVGPGDLVYVPEWVDNSLVTQGEVRWICLG